MKIACVIPAWNEESHIAKVIAGAKNYVDEVIVVDDCSHDNTAQIAKKNGAVVLRHPINRGQGAALQTGNEYALKNQADIIVHFDADDQFIAAEIKDIIEPLIADQADIVFGSRFLDRQTNFPFFKKYVIMPLGQIFSRVILGIKLSDPQNGFRAFNRRAAEIISIENRGMAHASEIQMKSLKNNLRIKEVPITVIYHRFGQKLSGGFKIIKDLFIYKIIK